MQLWLPLRLLVNSNLFISICALCMVWVTYLQLELSIVWWPLPVFVFFATLFIYNWHRLLSMDKRAQYGQPGMHHWILAHRRSAIIPIASSALVMAIGFWYLNTRIQLCLALLGILAMAYAVPVLRWRQGLIKLRDIGIFKPFLLASVWTGATALLPMLELNAPLSREWLLLLAQRWFFMAALCIPFDVKDMAYDRATMHSPTLPIRLGLAKTKAIAVVLLAGYLFIAFVRIGCQPALLGYALSFVYVLFLLLRNKTTDPEHYYTFWLDGAMILQLVGVGGYFLKIVW